MSAERLERARVALEGLSVGDAYGEQAFAASEPWHFTDDTNMSLSVFAVLREYGEINQDALAHSFMQRYHPMRGYGPAMHFLLPQFDAQGNWRQLAPALFDGQGSYGNGAAMRVAPVGAYFADDLQAVVENARRSAEVTHAHPEAVAGAIAVAMGAAWAWRLRDLEPQPTRVKFLEQVLAFVPDSEVKRGIQRAAKLQAATSVETAAAMLGNGSRVTCQDTVPFALWVAGEHFGRYREALQVTRRAGGDIDTTCAIVGGILANAAGLSDIPQEWRDHREPLPAWPFE